MACYLNARIVKRAAVKCVVTASLQCQQMLTASAMCAMLHNGMMLTLLSKAGSHSMGALSWASDQKVSVYHRKCSDRQGSLAIPIADLSVSCSGRCLVLLVQVLQWTVVLSG